MNITKLVSWLRSRKERNQYRSRIYLSGAPYPGHGEKLCAPGLSVRRYLCGPDPGFQEREFQRTPVDLSGLQRPKDHRILQWAERTIYETVEGDKEPWLKA